MRLFDWPRLAGLSLALAAAHSWAEPPKLDYPINSERIFLLNIASAGDRLVAVGERGVVMLSDDQAESWRSVRTSSNRTLAAVAFDSAKVGVAVGHGGVLLRSEDGGQSWAAQDLEEATNGDALLGVAAMGEGRMVAWGAFGLYLLSQDAGVTWQRIGIIDEEFDRHISQIIKLVDGRWLLVGESGTLALSSDQGQTWQALTSPYAGSFFGALQLQDGSLLAFGMRGNLWHSTDGGQSWSKRDSGTTLAFNGAVQLASGRVLVLGNGGLALTSDDQGQSFQRLNIARASLAKATELDDGRLIAVGDSGVRMFDAAALGRQE